MESESEPRPCQNQLVEGPPQVRLQKRHNHTIRNLVVGESKAIRLGAAECVEQDVEVANHRQNESVMDTDTIGYDALDDRQDRAANNSHIQKARATSTQSSESCLS